MAATGVVADDLGGVAGAARPASGCSRWRRDGRRRLVAGGLVPLPAGRRGGTCRSASRGSNVLAARRLLFRRAQLHQTHAVDADELGRLLEDRLGKVVPPGFQVAYSEDGLLRYTSDPGRFPGHPGTYQAGASGTYVRDNFTLWGDTDPERVVGACRQALDELQDYIDEASHAPWPGDRTPPRPFAELRGAEFVWGYGAPDAPVLECEPIPVDAV